MKNTLRQLLKAQLLRQQSNNTFNKFHKILSYFSEEYDIEELKAVYDSFTLGDLTTMQTGENPLKLALVNNNSSC